MKQKVLETINKYNLIKSGDFLIVGVSGGPDSICLLYILNELKSELNFKLCVAHINHMIRKEADDETKYVEEFCKKLDIDVFIKKADILKIAKKEKKGTEETGRNIRYEFFDEIAKKKGANKIATAHNNNDKIETIVMNILRGSGTSGLKGFSPIRDNKYIKPLIDCSRDEIEEYCKKNKLEPKYDKSNEENEYMRNKVRNIIIPYIKKEINPNIFKTINRLSEVIVEEDLYMNKIAKKEYEECKEENNSSSKSDCTECRGILHKPEEIGKKQIILDLKKFNDIELVIKRRIILYAINELLDTTQGIEKVNIDDIIKLCEKNIGNKFLKPIKNIKILVKNKKIFLIANNDLP